jgi:hypothetical protein
MYLKTGVLGILKTGLDFIDPVLGTHSDFQDLATI